MLPSEIMNLIQQRLGVAIDQYLIPPPVFTEMQGEFIDYDLDNFILTTRFPILEKYLNPYSTMQGGILCAAVDNTIGPLSLLVAPPNVTRHLEIKYSRPATCELAYIIVRGEFVERQKRQLKFRADVRDPQGTLLAKASAIHWIIDLKNPE